MDRREDDRWYPLLRDDGTLDPDKVVPSVTTILGDTVAKHGLPRAAARIAAEYVWDHFVANPRDEVVADAAGEHERQWGRKADAGTAVHKAMAAHFKGLDTVGWTPEEKVLAEPFMDSLNDFLTHGGYHPLWAEAKVYNTDPLHPFAGTTDTGGYFDYDLPVLDLREGSRRRIGTILAGAVGELDLKTGPGDWSDQLAQLVGYHLCPHMLPDKFGGPIEKPPTTWGAILKVRPDGWSVHPVLYDDTHRRAFLAARVLFEWLREHGPTAHGAGLRSGQLHLADVPGRALPTAVAVALANRKLRDGGPVLTVEDLAAMGQAGLVEFARANCDKFNRVGPARLAALTEILELDGRAWAAPALTKGAA